MTINSFLTQVLWAPLGQWRTQFLWRFFGIFVLVYAFSVLEVVSLEQLVFGPWDLYRVLACSLLMILFGGRGIFLLLQSIFTMGYWSYLHQPDVLLPIGDELLILMFLPAAGFLSLILCVCSQLTSSSSETSFSTVIEKYHVMIFRITVFWGLIFLGVHQLNAGFLATDQSCASVMTERWSLWWPLLYPDFLTGASPWFLILSEWIGAFLLVFLPPVGMLWVIGVMSGFAHAGFVPLATGMIMMSCAFYRQRDLEMIMGAMRHRLQIWLFFVLLFGFVSAKSYLGESAWFVFHVFQVTAVTLVFFLLYILREERRHLKAGFKQYFEINQLKDWPDRIPGKIFLRLFLIVLVGVCLTPYLRRHVTPGFALLSNLRVDTQEWNHLVFPSAMALKKSDPYVHIKRVDMEPQQLQRLHMMGVTPENGAIVPGLYSGVELSRRLNFMRRIEAELDLTFTYEHEKRAFFFQNAAYNDLLRDWLGKMKDKKLPVSLLPPNGPATCKR